MAHDYGLSEIENNFRSSLAPLLQKSRGAFVRKKGMRENVNKAWSGRISVLPLPL